jgi:hypothetical protein
MQGRGRQSVVGASASSTSYNGRGKYDNDAIFDDEIDRERDSDGDAKRERESFNSRGGGSSVGGRQRGREVVVIPCDLADPDSGVYVMAELKEREIDDKVDLTFSTSSSFTFLYFSSFLPPLPSRLILTSSLRYAPPPPPHVFCISPHFPLVPLREGT